VRFADIPAAVWCIRSGEVAHLFIATDAFDEFQKAYSYPGGNRFIQEMSIG
jgi:hypothetical protein